MELPVFSCENLGIENKIIFKNNKIYLKTLTIPCKVFKEKYSMCHSCEFDYLDNIDSYTIYFRIYRGLFIRVANDKDIKDEVDDEPIKVNDYDPEKSDCIIKNCKKDLEKIKRMIVNKENRGKII